MARSIIHVIRMCNEGVRIPIDSVTSSDFSDNIKRVLLAVLCTTEFDPTAAIKRISENLVKSGLFDIVSPDYIANILYPHVTDSSRVSILLQLNKEENIKTAEKQSNDIPSNLLRTTVDEIGKAMHSDWDYLSRTEQEELRSHIRYMHTVIRDTVRRVKSNLMSENTTTLKFGKYKGKTIKYVAGYDPQYILWLRERAAVNVPEEYYLAAKSKLRKINGDCCKH